VLVAVCRGFHVFCMACPYADACRISPHCTVADQGSTFQLCCQSSLFDVFSAWLALLHYQAERTERQQLEAQMRQAQEDARNAQMALVSQNGSLEGQCRAAMERMKQLEVGSAAGTQAVHHAPGCHEHNNYFFLCLFAPRLRSEAPSRAGLLLGLSLFDILCDHVSKLPRPCCMRTFLLRLVATRSQLESRKTNQSQPSCHVSAGSRNIESAAESQSCAALSSVF
jgi:hypothetical protein